MKSNTLKRLLVIGIFGALIVACETMKDGKYTGISEKEKEIIEYIRNNQGAADDLLDMIGGTVSNTEGMCVTACCDTLAFCGVPRDKVKKYITKYRNENWYESSPFFEDPELVGANVTDVMRDITNGEYPGNPYSNPDNFDSRFMDVPVVQLENYLCFIRNNLPNVNCCRFYYMKYDESDSINPEYHNKTTLAMVPTIINESTGLTTAEYTAPIQLKEGQAIGQVVQPIMVAGGSCGNYGIANHNHLCPPYECIERTMLYDIDKN